MAYALCECPQVLRSVVGVPKLGPSVPKFGPINGLSVRSTMSFVGVPKLDLSTAYVFERA